METRYLIHEARRAIILGDDIVGQAHGIERPDGLHWQITINEGWRGVIELPEVGPHRMAREAFETEGKKRLVSAMDERQYLIQNAADRANVDPADHWGFFPVDEMAREACRHVRLHARMLHLEADAEAQQCRIAADRAPAPTRDLTAWQAIGEMLGWGGLPATNP